jgi:hypothetical protein
VLVLTTVIGTEDGGDTFTRNVGNFQNYTHYYTSCFRQSTVYRKTLLVRAIPQAVSLWLPTAAARVQTRVWSSGICGGQTGAGAGFLLVLRFPLPIFIPPNSPSS